MLPRIDAVQVRPVAVPLSISTAFSTREVRERQYVLVRVMTDDGCVGIGFCYAGNMGGRALAIAVEELLAPVLIGQDPHSPEHLWQQMYTLTLLQGRTGMVMRGLSALDIAMWDWNARHARLPLYQLLGGSSVSTVPAYASGGYYWPDQSIDALAREMEEYVGAGFRAVKMKVGRLSLRADTERVAAVRSAVGADVFLMLDANNAWSDVETAERSIRAWEEFDPYWIEEPFSPDDVENHAKLNVRSRVPVATGEIETGRWRFLQLLKANGASVLQPDAAVCGGISEFRKIASTAASFGVSVYPHWFHDLHVHLVAATPNGRMVEFFPDSRVLNFRDLIDTQLTCNNGELMLPDTPGIGFDFAPDALIQFGLSDWIIIR